MASRMQVPPNSDLTLGMTCVDKATPGRCTWRMTADERFANPAGTMQGGFLAAFADSSMGAAAVTFVQGRKVFSANAEMKISFLAPVPPGAVLTCTAEVVSGGSTVAFVEASIFAGTRASSGDGSPAAGTDTGPGRLVARANSTYIYRSRD
ncbi:MAG: PaaI family thioesterase [Acidimicrobiales bacterium]